jgi:ABC-2 type transport system permease protein
MWNRIRALVIKEFLVLLKDKRSRMVIIAPPLVQLMVFGYAASYDLNRVSYGVLNEDPGAAARVLLAAFRGSETFRETAPVKRDGDIRRLIESRTLLAVIRVPADFTRNLERGIPAQVQVNIDGRNSNSALIVLGYIRAIVNEFNARWNADHGRAPPPAQLVVRPWFNPNLLSRWFIVTGIVGLLTLVVTMLVTALSVAREREAGTFDQTLVTPLRPGEILIGKALPAVLIGLVEATVIVLMIVLWFHIPLRGSLVALYLGLLLFLLSSIGVGLMISSLALTQQQGLLGAFLFLVPAIILSGFTTPIANMPVPLQYVTLINPMRYFLVVIRGVFLEGATARQLWPQYWPMAVIGLCCLFTAARLFRGRMH